MTGSATHMLEDQLLDAWQQLCRERFLRDVKPQDDPWAVLVVGQPASGKSVFIEAMRQGHAEVEFVVLSPGELEALHPARTVLARNGEYDVIDELHGEAAELAASLLDEAAELRCNVILECTFDCGHTAEALVRFLNDAGYDVSVIAIAVPPEVSRSDYIARRLLEFPDTCRTSAQDTSYHDEMYAGFVDAIAHLDESALCDVTLVDRSGLVPVDMSNGGRHQDRPLRELLSATSTVESADWQSRSAASPRSGELIHPRFTSPQPDSISTQVQPESEWTGFSSEERRRIEQRIQFLETLRRCAEAEQHRAF